MLLYGLDWMWVFGDEEGGEVIWIVSEECASVRSCFLGEGGLGLLIFLLLLLYYAYIFILDAKTCLLYRYMSGKGERIKVLDFVHLERMGKDWKRRKGSGFFISLKNARLNRILLIRSSKFTIVESSPLRPP